ncbi:MAG: Type restriction enzyme subunit, partial [Solirubrobacterales bacterium]|nr:Type restriction enzyme subunit [Solirubrobacterales bacterium]
DNNLMAVAPRDGDPSFWRYLLMTVDLGELSPGGPLPYVSEGQVRELRLRVPDGPLQRRIAEHLSEKLSHHDAAVAALVDMRAAALERRMLLTAEEVVGAQADGQRCAFELAWARDGRTAWPTVKLTHVARLGSGHTPSRSRPDWWTDCRIPWITTGEVQQVRDDRREVITQTRECISALGLANSAAALHPRGTVVLSRTASVGFSAVMGTDMATSQDFATWTCGPRLDPSYLLCCLRGMRPYLLGYLAQGSTHKTIYMPDIEALRIPLPPVEVQRTIVGRIREQTCLIDQFVDAADGQLRLLQERRPTLIAAAVTGQMNVAEEAA